jgi:hypothetical protein
MRKLLMGLILGIFIFGILGLGFAIAENNETGNQTNANQTNTCSPACDSDEICLNSTCVDNDSDDNETDDEDDEEDDNETEDDEDGRVTINKTRISRENLTFSPWQKRNESECLEGCSCHGAVMSCETETGRIITIQAGRSGNIIVITIDGTEVETELEVEAENEEEDGVQERNKTKLKVKLENGSKKEIKIMPDAASERALERLRLKVCNSENNCAIELKEVGSGKNKQLAYELQAERHMKVLAVFKAKALVKAQIDTETGEIIVVKKPWWAFLATEPEE